MANGIVDGDFRTFIELYFFRMKDSLSLRENESNILFKKQEEFLFRQSHA